MKRCIIIVLLFFIHSGLTAQWTKGYFKLEKRDGRMIFIDPNGEKFYSKAMCYAWGPDTGEYSTRKNTPEKVIKELERMKEHGFNTLNLYGLVQLEAILTWCDENEMAFYPRMSYFEFAPFNKMEKEWPDFMDPQYREEAKKYFDRYCKIFKKHPSVIAIDMDQRWLFLFDWGGVLHKGILMLGKKSIEYLPVWLKRRYKNINELNQVWRKEYQSFDDVILDEEIVLNDQIVEFKKVPWRLDLFEYTLWTMNDFLKELTAYIRSIDIPQRLVTITTELPEVCPFPLATKANSGIDFLSPVHYNAKEDYNRDWIGMAELLYMTKWHNDMQKMPVYISETGFRTSSLNQQPANYIYAMGKKGDEPFIAEMYCRQIALMNIWPWMLGWTHFKWFDKLEEGDFGYIRDNMEDKPVSELGKYINHGLKVNYSKEKEHKVWIYYPEYALASSFTSYPQFKSLVTLLEIDFLKDFEKMIKKNKKYFTEPSSAILKSDLCTKLVSTYQKRWMPFKFTSTIPKDDKPIIIAGRSLEQLSLSDRKELEKKRLIIMCQAGMEDPYYNKTENWYLTMLGLKGEVLRPKYIPVDINRFYNNNGIDNKKGDFISSLYIKKKSLKDNSKLFELSDIEVPLNISKKKKDNIICKGQTIKLNPEIYNQLHFLITSVKGDHTCKIKLIYTDGSKRTVYVGKTVTDWHFKPFFSDYAKTGKDNKNKRVYLSYIPVKCNVMKKLKSIVLPKNKYIRVFSITLEQSKAAGSDIDITVKSKKGVKSKGKSYWVIPFKKNEIKNNILAVFSNGSPAILQSLDKRKVVYLYDALTWIGQEDEISWDINNQASILKEMIQHVKRK